MTGRSGGDGQRTGRRGGYSGTREAILAAARARFGEAGYDRATIRSIAAAAGVDPALVHHFFGHKERLFAAAMRLPLVPGDVVQAALLARAGEQGAAGDGAGAGAPLGELMLRAILDAWEMTEMRAAFLGLLRTAVASDDAAVMLREYVTDAILGRIAQGARDVGGGEDSDFRAALIASQVLGLALTRYVLRLPALERATNSELAAAIGPNLDRYLAGGMRRGAAGRGEDGGVGRGAAGRGEDGGVGHDAAG